MQGGRSEASLWVFFLPLGVSFPSSVFFLPWFFTCVNRYASGPNTAVSELTWGFSRGKVDNTFCRNVVGQGWATRNPAGGSREIKVRAASALMFPKGKVSWGHGV